MRKLFPTILLIVAAVAVLTPTTLLIAGTTDYVPLAPLPNTTTAAGGATLQTYIPGIYKLGVGMAGVLAVLMITWGGLEYMMSEAVSSKAEAKKRIWSALGGLILAFLSYVILYTINPNLVTFSLNL